MLEVRAVGGCVGGECCVGGEGCGGCVGGEGCGGLYLR